MLLRLAAPRLRAKKISLRPPTQLKAKMTCTLSNEQKDFLYALYLLLRTAPLVPQSRYRAFEAAACDLPQYNNESLGDALSPFLCICGAKHSPRAYRWMRRERTEQIFKCAVPMKRDAMLLCFYEYDKVTLAMAEDADECSVEWPDGVPVPAELKKGYTFPEDGAIESTWTEAQLAAYAVSQVLVRLE